MGIVGLLLPSKHSLPPLPSFLPSFLSFLSSLTKCRLPFLPAALCVMKSLLAMTLIATTLSSAPRAA